MTRVSDPTSTQPKIGSAFSDDPKDKPAIDEKDQTVLTNPVGAATDAVGEEDDPWSGI